MSWELWAVIAAVIGILLLQRLFKGTFGRDDEHLRDDRRMVTRQPMESKTIKQPAIGTRFRFPFVSERPTAAVRLVL